ncbi:MAG: rhamnogalacturonan lyase [Opitutaceae bacterium]
MRHASWLILLSLPILSPLAAATPSPPPRRMEALSRGLVALPQADGRVAVTWRLLGTDPADVTFNLYRHAEPPPTRSGEERSGRFGPRGPGTDPTTPRRLHAEPLRGATFFLDETANLATRTTYTVRAVIAGRETGPGERFSLAAGTPPLPYLSVPLQPPEGAIANDASAGDLDGDGHLDLVVKFEQRPRDNSQGGATGVTSLQGYRLFPGEHGLASELLWTISLGRNIREGAHYTQFQVYDLDGDGRAEVACKTADGTRDGRGRLLGDPAADWVQPAGARATILAPPRGGGPPVERTVDTTGHILSGPEFLTVFDGRTGAALATAPYAPARVEGTTAFNPQALQDTWGDATGNRSDRYLAATAFLDGERPSLIFCRGYYTRSTIAAWDWRDGRLRLRWFFDSDAHGPRDASNPFRGQGNHNLAVADVDGDGRDEIVYGAMVIDDDGRPLYSTRWGHGDALHVSDLVPANPGLEIFSIQERFDLQGMNLRDARTGRPLFLVPSVRAATSGGDAGEGPGRGVAFNIDPRHPGAEFWAAGAGMTGLYSAAGERLGDRRPRSCNFAVWWDGDLLRELLDQNRITKWNWDSGTETLLLAAQGATANNGTKSNPALCADLLGDWREEVVWRSLDGRELRIYVTPHPTPHRMTTLLHDPQYRLSIAWQNTAYNQPPHPSFFLDEGAPLPPRPRITTIPPSAAR